MADDAPVALVTGGARRIGAAIVATLHAAGYRILLHCHRSGADAEALSRSLCARRADSVAVLSADLCVAQQVDALAAAALRRFGRVDALVNNASLFFPTRWKHVSRQDWHRLLESNVAAPLFLCQALTPELTRRRGSIVNLTDIYATRPLRDHAPYSVAKAGLEMLTRALAAELGPAVRVNAVAPGNILWPEAAAGEAAGEMNAARRQALIDSVPLRRQGKPEEVAGMVLFLLRDAVGVHGQIFPVDGGRKLALR